MPEVHVFMAEGRTDEQKKDLMLSITKAMTDSLDCPTDAVTVQIVESKFTEKMKGGKTFG
jgi:4-oxalocrotonate tautomerase